MYKHLSAEEYKKRLNLPSDYRVDGMLCYGTWDIAKHIKLLQESVADLGRDYSFGELPYFLNKVVEFNIDGRRFWFDVSYGGALLSEYLHLACQFGSQKNILLGSCGGLSSEMHSLDLVMPTASFGNESPTRMYNPEAVDNLHYPNEQLSEQIRQSIAREFKVWQGKTTTCQAMMAETWDDIQNWSQAGYLGVEMEAATVFAVSSHFQVPSAALLVVADNLIQGETVGSESYIANRPKKELIRQEQYRVALQALLS